jgi:monoterpene epsilon-lactone hydrolase
MPSISSKNINTFLKLFNFKKSIEKALQSPPRSVLHIPKYIQNNFQVNVIEILNHQVVTIEPKNQNVTIHVLFFHGGAYWLQGNAMHWKIVENIAGSLHCRVSYFDYPLAPENTYTTTFDMLQQSYTKLTASFPSDRFMLMGDSAGGGLALAFAQKLFAEKAKIQPVKIVVFSPWLDLTMENPAIKQQEELDLILPLNALKQAALKYAGGQDLNHYLLSPMYGELEGIGDTLVLYGTHELFYPDCQKLKEMTIGRSNFHFREFHGMQHDWVIFPINEAKTALKIAIEFCGE